MQTSLPRVYLAGPEVFRPDALVIGAEKCRLCSAHGFEGLFPLDASLDLTGLPKQEAARRIALSNEGLMNSADAVIANLTPFRGVSMDSGTAFEVGYMRALRKPVLGYSNAGQDLAARSRMFRLNVHLSYDCDRPAFEIEDFDMAENLMIAVAVLESGSPVIAQDIHGDDHMANLTGFRQCLELLQKLVG